MMPLVLIAAIAGLPTLLALLLRVSSVMIFLAIAVGALMERSAGDSVELALNMVVRSGPVSSIAHVGTLVLPVLLTIIFLRKSAKGSSMLLHIVPLVAGGCALALLVLPLLPVGLQNSIYAQPIGATARQSSDLVVSAAAALNLLLAWRIHAHPKDKHGKHH